MTTVRVTSASAGMPPSATTAAPAARGLEINYLAESVVMNCSKWIISPADIFGGLSRSAPDASRAHLLPNC
jgi:hypothetical protein